MRPAEVERRGEPKRGRPRERKRPAVRSPAVERSVVCGRPRRRRAGLPALLLVAVLAEPLFPLVGGDLVALALTSAGHRDRELVGVRMRTETQKIRRGRGRWYSPPGLGAGFIRSRRLIGVWRAPGGSPPDRAGWRRASRPRMATRSSPILDTTPPLAGCAGGRGGGLWSPGGGWHGPCQNSQHVRLPCNARYGREERCQCAQRPEFGSAHVGRTRTGERVRPASFFFGARAPSRPSR